MSRVLKRSLLLAASLSVSAWAGEPPLQFTVQPFEAADLQTQWRACVGERGDAQALQAFEQQVRELQLSDGQAEFGATAGARSVLLAWDGQWTCVALSAQGWPQWPVEALQAQIRLPGVATANEQGFLRALLVEIGQQGRARGLLRYESGAATEVSVFASPYEAGRLLLATRVMKSGSYSAERYTIQLKDPELKTLELFRRGNDAWQSTLGKISRMRAQDGEFVRVTGTAATQEHALAGSRWLTEDRNTAMTLIEAGQVSMAQGKTTTTGVWTVVDGVLRLQMVDGRRYSLVLGTDNQSLKGVMRRTLPQDLKLPIARDAEFRNYARFKRQP